MIDTQILDHNIPGKEVSAIDQLTNPIASNLWISADTSQGGAMRSCRSQASAYGYLDGMKQTAPTEAQAHVVRACTIVRSYELQR